MLESPIEAIPLGDIMIPGSIRTTLIIVGLVIILVASSILMYHWYRYAYDSKALFMGVLYVIGILALVIIGLILSGNIV